MLVYLLYMLVFLAKEEQLLSQQVRLDYFEIRSESKSSLRCSFISYNFSQYQLPGLSSAQSAGPVHLSALETARPVVIPGHSGIC